MTDDEFGQLIIHDGKTMPPKGSIVKAFYKVPLSTKVPSAMAQGADWVIGTFRTISNSWSWKPGFNPIISYKIKKGLGFKLLEKIASDPPKKMIEDSKPKQLEHHK